MKAQLIGAALVKGCQILRRVAANTGAGWIGKKYFIFPAAVACEMVTGHFNQLQEQIGIPDGLRFGVTLACATILGEALEDIIQSAVGKTKASYRPLLCRLAATICVLSGGLMSDIQSAPSLHPSQSNKVQVTRDIASLSDNRRTPPGKKYEIIFPEPRPRA